MGKSEGMGVVEEVGEGQIGQGKGSRDGGIHPKTLTERMTGLLERVCQYDYLTIREVELFYANQTHAYRVLKFLEKEGLLGSFPTSMSPRTAYCLSSKGYRLLARAGRLRVPGRFRPEAYQIHLFSHKTACAKAGIILESHPLVRDFLPEKLLWSGRRRQGEKVCDGEFSLHVPQRGRSMRVGLEVELTIKNAGKLADCFRDLEARQDLGAVFWVCGERNLLRTLGRELRDRRWSAGQRHLLTTLEELVANRHRVSLEDPEGETYSLDPDRLRLPMPEPPYPGPAREQERGGQDEAENELEPEPRGPEAAEDEEEYEEPLPLPGQRIANPSQAPPPGPAAVQPFGAQSGYVEIKLSDVLAMCGRFFREVREVLPALLLLAFICVLAHGCGQLVRRYLWG